MAYKRKKGQAIVRNRKKSYSFKGVDYKSKLEHNMAVALDREGIWFQYEPTKFLLQEGFKLKLESFERQSNGKGDFKQRGCSKILPITYTPDFMGEGFICETKGYQNEAFPNKWKSFKKILNDRFDETVHLFKPQTNKEVENTVRILLEKEEWKEVEGYEDMYEISNYGRVKSLTRKVKSKIGLRTQKESILSQRSDKDGYKLVTLSKNTTPQTVRVHRLVTTAFLKNPDNLSDVNHLDENKENNGVSNLEWSSHLNNMRHSGFEKTKKKVNRYNKQNELIKTYNSLSEVIVDGFSKSAVSQCCNGITKSSGGFVWKYEK